MCDDMAMLIDLWYSQIGGPEGLNDSVVQIVREQIYLHRRACPVCRAWWRALWVERRAVYGPRWENRPAEVEG